MYAMCIIGSVYWKLLRDFVRESKRHIRGKKVKGKMHKGKILRENILNKSSPFSGYVKGKRPLLSHRRRWYYNIKMNLQDMRCGSMDWIELAQNRDSCPVLGITVINCRVP